MKPIVSIALAATLTIPASLAFAVPSASSISALPTPVGGSSQAYDISDTGITGYVDNGEGELTYVVWTATGVEEYHPFGDFDSIGLAASNNNGVVVGGGYGFRQPPQAIAWYNGVGTALANEDNDADDTEFLFGSTARAVNDAGTIVGYGDTQYGASGIVWHTDGNIELLHSINPTSGVDYAAAADINNSGVIAGLATVGDLRHAVTWNNGVATDLGIFAGGTLASANAINDHGQVVGWGDTGPDGGVAFISDGTENSLVALPNIEGMAYGEAFDVNNLGWAVGACIPNGLEGNGVATLWIEGVAYDLNDFLAEDSGWELLSADGITDDGTVVGWGIYNGQYLGYQMTVVPAPAVFSGFVAAGLFAGRRRR